MKAYDLRSFISSKIKLKVQKRISRTKYTNKNSDYLGRRTSL